MFSKLANKGIFHPLEVVGGCSETQLQVGRKNNYLIDRLLAVRCWLKFEPFTQCCIKHWMDVSCRLGVMPITGFLHPSQASINYKLHPRKVILLRDRFVVFQSFFTAMNGLSLRQIRLAKRMLV